MVVGLAEVKGEELAELDVRPVQFFDQTADLVVEDFAAFGSMES